MRFVDPKNDVAFKKIFGDEHHKEVLISFLNAVLELKGEQQIADIQILNPYQAPRLAYLKSTLLDIPATNKRGISFIVEMQVEAVDGFKQRFQYYAAKTYSGQIERGKEYHKLNAVYFIGILDFTAFESKKYLSRHLILNLENHDHDLDAIEFYFIQLTKFTKKEHELTTPLDKWVYFIKHAEDLTVIPESTDIEALKTAYAVAESYNWSKDELEVYDYWEMKRQDERGAITAGEKRGVEIGRKEGEKAAKLATARSMLADGMEAALVTKYTGLTLAELAEA